VTEDMTEPDTAGQLRVLGQVGAPAPGVLEAAREVLWSAVAEEALSADLASDSGRTTAAATDRAGEDIRRHRADPGS
jgi:hypothetical protein